MNPYLFVALVIFGFLEGTTDPSFEKISDSPRIYVCPHFLSDRDCDHIKELARPLLTPSTVVDAHSENPLLDSRRTSQGGWLPPYIRDSVILNLQKEIATLTAIPEKNGENIQILYYPLGGEYQPHYDYFDPSTAGGLYHYQRGGQRVATFMIYLNTVEEGGETIFPRLGIKIKPEKGKALLFYDVNPSGNVDPMTLHGGAPVLKGEKWILTRWLREGEFH